MIEIEVIAKKWGNSLGFIFPNKIVKEVSLKPGKPIKALLRIKK